MVDINATDWQVYDSEALLVSAVTDLIEARLRQAISEKAQFHLVFPGGRSIVPVLQALSNRTLTWQGVHLYLTDERCVSRGDTERNDRLVDEFLLSSIPADPPVLHRIPAELGPDKGAEEFARQLGATPAFDLVLLGLGEDGHTASLFPDSLDDEPTEVVAVHHSPKPPAGRVSLGYARLVSARERVVLAMGETKRAVIRRIRAGELFPVVKARPDRWFITADIYA